MGKANIYLTDQPNIGRNQFILHCCRLYCGERGIGADKLRVRTRSCGKPYISGNRIHISFSDSHGCMAVAIHDAPIGLDMEFTRKLDYERISRRFFSEPESDFIAKTGSMSFFIIWTMKESYLKYHGVPPIRVLKELVTASEKGLTLFQDGLVFEPFCADRFVLCTCKQSAGNRLIRL